VIEYEKKRVMQGKSQWLRKKNEDRVGKYVGDWLEKKVEI